MKIVIAAILASVMSSISLADQRFETVGGFCHFVTPEGFANDNDDNEVFFANCENSIRQHDDGTGSGSTTVTVDYPQDALPFIESYGTTYIETTVNDTAGINCVMVDSNGTVYVSQDWWSQYTVKGRKIKYQVHCVNGQQQ